jgi:hypothetical protein
MTAERPIQSSVDSGVLSVWNGDITREDFLGAVQNFTANALRCENENERLLRWHTVKELTTEASAKFQAVAAQVAKRQGAERAHLHRLLARRAKFKNSPRGVRGESLESTSVRKLLI